MASSELSAEAPKTSSAATARARSTTLAESFGEPAEILPRPFGKYELRSLLGRGGMGAVYLAYDPSLDRLVALKIPRPLAEEFFSWRERFLAEARAAAVLHHPNICPVHDVGEIGDQPYLTMPYLEGETLAARLKRAGSLPVAEAFELIGILAKAMGEAHQRGIVHRDLKPANVMIDQRGQPIIMDFGLAHRAAGADDLRLTLTGVAMGTPEYMPPEQAGGDYEAIGPASDVYSLGVILHEMLTGAVPFKAKSFGKLVAQIERDAPPSPRSQNPEIDPAAESIIFKCLQKSPAKRFATGTALSAAIEEYRRGVRKIQSGAVFIEDPRAINSDQATAPYKIERRPSRWPLVAGALAGLAIVMILLFSVFDPLSWLGLRTVVEQKPPNQPGQNDPPPKPPGDDKTKTPSVTPAAVIPLVLPTKATVIELANWTILTDASKLEMQSWLDTQKAAKHSVVWLDAVTVSEKPFYSAIAVHDESNKDWQAYLEMAPEEFNDVRKLAERVDVNSYLVASLAGYTESRKLKTAALFQAGRNPHCIPAQGPLGMLQTGIQKYVDSGYYVKLLRPTELNDKAQSFVLFLASSTSGESLHQINIDESAMKAALDELKVRRRVPILVAPCLVKGQLRFTLTANDESSDIQWRQAYDLTSADLNAKSAEMLETGFSPQSIIAYAFNGAIRYSTIWVKPPPPPIIAPEKSTKIELPLWHILTDASKEEIKTWIDEKKKNSHSVMWIDALTVDDKTYFSAVAALDDRQKEFVALFDLTSDQINNPQKLGEIDPNTHRVASLSGYRDQKEVKGIALFHRGVGHGCVLGEGALTNFANNAAKYLQGGFFIKVIRPIDMGGNLQHTTAYLEPSTNTKALHGINETEAAFSAASEKFRAAGHYPICITPMARDGALRFTYAFNDKSTKDQWRHHLGQTASELAITAKQSADDGYHLTSLVPYAFNGAIRYSTVWLKEPPAAPPDPPK